MSQSDSDALSPTNACSTEHCFSQQKTNARYQKPRGDGNTVMFTSLSLTLLAFFILLFALSSPKSKDKQLELALEIKKAFQSMGGLFSDIGDAPQVGKGRQDQTLEVSSQVESLLADLSSFVEKEEDLEDFSYEVSREEFKMQIPTDFTFQAGSAQINPKAFPFLDKIFDMIRRTENKLRIEGHTDDLPSRNALFDSNWELSAARAVNVLRYFTNKKVVPESRFSAIGYGRYRPISSNRLSSGREKNRRIMIIFIGAMEPLGGALGTGK